MTRRLAALALVAGCATPTTPTVAGGLGEDPTVTVGTVSPPSPVARLESPRPTPAKASRSRPAAANGRRTGTLDWSALRQCENSGSYRSQPTDRYRGAYQFDYSTWASVGGSGDPAAASPAEQDYRAQLLYKARGRAPWPVCGRHL